jgi:hypothetical protein
MVSKSGSKFRNSGYVRSNRTSGDVGTLSFDWLSWQADAKSHRASALEGVRCRNTFSQSEQETMVRQQNDAPSVLTRLTDMEVAPYITSSAVLAVISQRLVRVLCPHCKKETRMDADAAEALGFEPERLAGQPVFEAVGCDRCIGTGYRGRLGVFEIMVLDDEARRLFLHQAPSEELRALAIRSGMRTLREDALEKVLAGTTSAAEVARVVM